MGLHKLIYTERAFSKQLVGLPEEDRQVARAIIAQAKAVRAFEANHAIEASRLGESVISQAYLQVGYVGNIPSEDGTYLVADPSTESTQIVLVHDGKVQGTRPIPVERFNLPTFRWFLLGRLAADDFRGLRNLPTTKETAPR
jgi:hypothetical protein